MFINFIKDFPKASCIFPVICLMDGANCVMNNHDDFWLPLSLAVLTSVYINRISNNIEGDTH